MALVFVLQIYFIASSTCEDWQTINIYNKMVVPNRIYTIENSSVTIYCGSSSPVYWAHHFNGPYWPNIEDRHTLGTNQITLNKLLQRDSGFYYCNGVHEGQAFNVSALMIVYDRVPKSKVVPNWVEVLEGSSVTLYCGNSVEWFSVNFGSQNKTIRNNTLTLYNLRKKHSGQYVCRGVDRFKMSRHPFTSVFHSVALIVVEGVVRRVNTLKPRNN